MNEPKKVVDLEILAEHLAKINYPKSVTQSMESVEIHNEMTDRMIPNNNKMIDKIEISSPISVGTQVGYKFLIHKPLFNK